ncbi:MAG TPA: hypothetical protein VFB51_02145 [Solirubrobacterales bacterium]|nr:hypothetical protein [Solirubrobacterales bacterium]
MNEFDSTQVSPEIVAAADQRAASVNGFGSATPEAPFEDRPEMLLGAAFAGGFLLAKILRRLAG